MASRLMKKLDLRRIPDKQDMFETDGVYVQMLDRDLLRVQPRDIDEDYDVVIFLSRHSSKRHMKSMTVHATGNFGEDTSLGGRSKQLAPQLHSR
jgi:D-tyrosyl-tRNA(Tyr) deacylase